MTYFFFSQEQCELFGYVQYQYGHRIYKVSEVSSRRVSNFEDAELILAVKNISECKLIHSTIHTDNEWSTD